MKNGRIVGLGEYEGRREYPLGNLCGARSDRRHGTTTVISRPSRDRERLGHRDQYAAGDAADI